jgi:hypothetical protein
VLEEFVRLPEFVLVFTIVSIGSIQPNWYLGVTLFSYFRFLFITRKNYGVKRQGNLLTKILLSHQYVSTSVRQYASTPVCQYISMSVHQYAVWLQYVSTSVRQYISTSVRQYVSTPVRQYVMLAKLYMLIPICAQFCYAYGDLAIPICAQIPGKFHRNLLFIAKNR